MAGQDPSNPQRIVLTWEALTCLQLNAPFTMYIIEYGRQDGIGGVRTLTRLGGRKVRSSASTSPTGLGFLDQGAIYFFRLAAQNVNGVGLFSVNVLGLTANVFTGEKFVVT